MSVHADPPPPLVSEPRGYQYSTGPQLGKGGFAICHRAEQLDRNRPTGQIVALKIVKSKMEPPKLAQKFVTELQIHSKLHHPNIVTFYRAFSFEQNTYVVLELCENGSLADALKKRKYFTMPEIRRFLIQTCGAIKYLHARSIIHRDLKTGNLFLDKDMNIKVGDFGLAALLVSQNDLGARRTTMCGTPNYLAPEILERGGRGHNEKVDLWAIGIIAYTLAVGRAPFHAPKREDIYKKLVARDYKWPDLSKTQNDISIDLRDLVSSLLVHEDDRPDPDQIVSHQFFKTSYIPLQLSSNCVSRVPRWDIRPPTAEVLARGYSDHWYTLCKESGVGEYGPGKTFPAFGGRKIRSVIKDCAKEVEMGRQPSIPFESVYLPFPDRTALPSSTGPGLSQIVEEKESSSSSMSAEGSGSSAEGPFLAEITANDRAKPKPLRIVRSAGPAVPSKENQEPSPPPPQVERMIEAQPKRTRSVRKAPLPPVTAVRQSRTTRSGATLERTRPRVAEPRGSAAPKVEIHQETRPSSSITSDKESVSPPPERIVLPERPAPSVDDSLRVPFSDPAAVLARVAKFRDNVARALANKSSAPRRSSPVNSLPFVSKWVDYSRKHGVGYVLEDGGIGIVMNATKKHPVTHFVARNGYSHLKAIAENPKAIEKVPLEYFEDTDGKGLKSIEVDRERRKATSILWLKFGRYMCQQLGQTERAAHADKDGKPTAFVRFYQRLGSVGIWGFGDGSFQFNFPDHTKLVMSADANHCNFTCLSVEAVAHLTKNGDLPFKYIRQRDKFTSSLHNLLYGSGGETVALKEVTEANLLRKKLIFIINLMDQWTAGGGIGCLPEGADRMQWDGPQLEDGKRQDWVTVGRFGGDNLAQE